MSRMTDEVRRDSPELFLFGDIETKSVSDGRMRMAGFVSTPKSDLMKEIVEVDAFEEYLSYYQRNPIYCYNHDKTFPIGKVFNVSLVKSGVKTGLYFDDITLAPIPIVKEVIWPLVNEGVLTQQSIGFLSLKGQFNGDVYHHQKVYLLEASLVPIACNPEATIDSIKSVFGKLPDGYEAFDTFSDLMKAFEKGMLQLPSEVRKVYAIPETEPMNTLNSTQSESTVPDFADAVVLAEKSESHDPDGEERVKPHKNERGYAEVCDMIHAAKSDTRGSYLFQIAVPTAKGFKYDWKHLAVSMSRVLGGNGGAHFSREQKAAIIDRIALGYEALGKDLPYVEFDDGQVLVNKLQPEVLETTRYKDIEFASGEKDAVRVAFLEKDLQSVANALQSFKKEGEIPDAVKDVIKALGGYVDVSFYASINDPVALEFISNIIDLLEEFVSPGSEADEGVFMSSPDGVAKNIREFADHLHRRADAMVPNETGPPDNKSEAGEVATFPLVDIKRLLDECGKLSELIG